MNTHPAPSERTRVRRLPARAHYDSETINGIVDAATVCSVAFQWEGSVHALPTIHWREGEHLYIHGAKGSRMLKALTTGQACVTIALADGLVMARSAMHHSMNYRAVVVYGCFEQLDEPDAKLNSLRALIEGIAPGRWEQLRPITGKELNATTVLRIPLTEASAKIRAGGVKDDEEDLGWPVWSGVIPLQTVRGTPVTEPDSVVRDTPANVLNPAAPTV